MIILGIISGVVLIMIGLWLSVRTNIPLKEEPKPKEAEMEIKM